MRALITREQAIQLVGSERELNRLLLNSFTGKLMRLRGSTAKLFAKNWLGPNPIFEIRSGIYDSDGSDIQEAIEALERGESGLTYKTTRVEYMGC